MARSYEIEITRAVLTAQIASDMAKEYQKQKCAFYRVKDKAIKYAIKLICVSKSTNCHFSVTEGDITPYLVYFTFNLSSGEKLQVSFHSFSAGLEKYISYKHKVRWDHNSSRASIIYVAKYYNIYYEFFKEYDEIRGIGNCWRKRYLQ